MLDVWQREDRSPRSRRCARHCMRNGFSGCSDCRPNFSLQVKCGRLGARHDGQRWSVLDTYDDLGEHNAIFVVANFVITFHLIKGNWATLKGWRLFLTGRRKSTDQLILLVISSSLILVAGTLLALGSLGTCRRSTTRFLSMSPVCRLGRTGSRNGCTVTRSACNPWCDQHAMRSFSVR